MLINYFFVCWCIVAIGVSSWWDSDFYPPLTSIFPFRFGLKGIKVDCLWQCSATVRSTYIIWSSDGTGITDSWFSSFGGSMEYNRLRNLIGMYALWEQGFQIHTGCFFQTRAVPKAMTNFEIWEKLGEKIEKNPFGIMS